MVFEKKTITVSILSVLNNVTKNVNRCVDTVDQDTEEVFVEELMIQKHTAQITGFRGNPHYAAELELIPLPPADETTSHPAGTSILYSHHHHHHRRRHQ